MPGDYIPAFPMVMVDIDRAYDASDRPEHKWMVMHWEHAPICLTYEAAANALSQYPFHHALCVDVPRAAYVRSVAEAHAFFHGGAD